MSDKDQVGVYIPMFAARDTSYPVKRLGGNTEGSNVQILKILHLMTAHHLGIGAQFLVQRL